MLKVRWAKVQNCNRYHKLYMNSYSDRPYFILAVLHQMIQNKIKTYEPPIQNKILPTYLSLEWSRTRS